MENSKNNKKDFIEELLKNPNGESEKAQFVGFASAFTEYFNGLAGNMEALQKN